VLRIYNSESTTDNIYYDRESRLQEEGIITLCWRDEGEERWGVNSSKRRAEKLPVELVSPLGRIGIVPLHTTVTLILAIGIRILHGSMMVRVDIMLILYLDRVIMAG